MTSETRVTIIDSKGRLATRVYASLADIEYPVSIGTLVCIDNGTTGEFYVRVSSPSGDTWQPITGGISHVSDNGTALSPDPATLNFSNSDTIALTAITDITDPSKANISANAVGLVKRVISPDTTVQTGVSGIGFTAFAGSSISVSEKNSDGNVYVGIGISARVIEDVTVSRGAVGTLLQADIVNNTLNIIAPDPCDCGTTLPPVKQSGPNSACNGANGLAIWLTGIANTALSQAISQASSPISTGILSVIAVINSDLADFGWLLNALSAYWNGSQLSAIQSALNTAPNQALLAQSIYCAVGSATKITGGTLSQIANVIQGNFTDIALNDFLYNFVLSLAPGQADLNYQIAALDTAASYDCSAYDCTALQHCYSINPANLQPFYVPFWVVPSTGIRYSAIAGAFYFPIPPYTDSQLVGLRLDLYTVLGTIPSADNPYLISFNASLQTVAQGTSDTAYPLADTLAADNLGQYRVTARFIELRGLSESIPGAITGGLELTGLCYRTAPVVSVNLTYTYGAGPATARYGDIITISNATPDPYVNCSNGLGYDLWINFDIPVKLTIVSVNQWASAGCDSTNTLLCWQNSGHITGGDPHGMQNVRYPSLADPSGSVINPCTQMYILPVGHDTAGAIVRLKIESV